MVGVVAGDLHVHCREQAVGQRTEEMRHQFGRQPAHGVAPELAFEHGIRTARQVDGHLRLRLVHRQHEAETCDAALVAERLAQSLAQCQRAVLDGVVLVDLEVARAGELEREAAVSRNLLEHVIVEADAGRNGDRTRAVEVHPHPDVGFLRLAQDSCRACRAAQLLDDGSPRCAVAAVGMHA